MNCCHVQECLVYPDMGLRLYGESENELWGLKLDTESSCMKLNIPAEKLSLICNMLPKTELVFLVYSVLILDAKLLIEYIASCS